MASDKPNQSRRGFMGTTAGFAIAPFLANQAKSASHLEPGEFPVVVIASGNGLESVKQARQMILNGDDPLDATIAGVNIVEDDPNDTSVGYGGLPNEDGVVELDAAVMHGPSHRAGSVSALQNIKNPSKVAKLVMEHTDHVMLVAEGALKFAKAFGFKEEDLLTDNAREKWLQWKLTRSDKDDWIPALTDEDEKKRDTGTIHCAGMNPNGDISCVTTTSGLAYKIPGRVGDSPIIGAGLYVDNDIGSCGSTGRGEANLQNLCCFAGVELMRNGMSPEEAGLEILRRVAEKTVPRLLNEKGRPNFGLNFYLLAKDGTYAGVTMHAGAKFAVADENGARREECVPLYKE